MVITLLLSIVFIGLGIIHFNWVFGGKWGFQESLPTNRNGEKVLNPKTIDCLIVGFFLIVFGMFYFLKLGLITLQMPHKISTIAGWTIPIIFLLRAVGEFNYIGFFKQVKGTEFAKLDSKYFSPLCLIVGLLGIITQINTGI
ncbi:DUF3995 domain-containing protein [Xanthomarina sp. F1114]|uniref:DUF3995 domain-containing protein n=1 Tax=Xanthomarina sp. F1114 TaxID=2996019 RepID=UPI00225DF262|nr:DUF3995 domain-containing protein [Xanthomarina sp. F1114]MCX7546344.1 DUF3995 domain-containing protein [Xanthomarina sp. F1114]